MSKSFEFNQLESAKQAYAEKHYPQSKWYSMRDLDWRSAPMPMEMAKSVMLQACNQYNGFVAETVFQYLTKWSKVALFEVQLARECSPALYLLFKTEEEAKLVFEKVKRVRNLSASTRMLTGTTIRLWWD